MRSFVRHTTFRSRLYVLDVLVERAASHFELRCPPRIAPLLHLVIIDVDIDATAFCVDSNFVACLNQSDRSAFLQLRV